MLLWPGGGLQADCAMLIIAFNLNRAGDQEMAGWPDELLLLAELRVEQMKDEVGLAEDRLENQVVRPSAHDEAEVARLGRPPIQGPCPRVQFLVLSV